jgi:hypothetical protein
MRECTEELFLKDVAQHQMTVIRDDGVHRHVRFKKSDSGNMYFDIVTYPHFLVYSGDMGCYVFSRINDMFEFFRGKSEGPLRINEGYWAEKLEATDRPDGHKEYSADRFREYVADRLEQIKEAQTVDVDSDDEGQSVAAAFDEFEQAVKDNVLAYADAGDFRAHQALDEFEHDGHRWFSDSWEAHFDEYTFRFTWCCYALAWSIRQYDAAKVQV